MFLAAVLAAYWSVQQDASTDVAAWAPSLPGLPVAYADGHQTRIGTGAAEVVFVREAEGYRIRAHSAWIDQDLDLAVKPFVIRFRSGRRIDASTMTAVGVPTVAKLQPEFDRGPGRSVTHRFVDTVSGLEATWRLIAREGSHYVRSEVTVTASRRDADVVALRLFEASGESAPEASAMGRWAGAPLGIGNWFVVAERAIAVPAVASGRFHFEWAPSSPMRKGRSEGDVIALGAAPSGQHRRAFMRYVLREALRRPPYAASTAEVGVGSLRDRAITNSDAGVYAFFGGDWKCVPLASVVWEGRPTPFLAAPPNPDRDLVLRDAHWVGGDPARFEVYGWAGWSGRWGVVTLRNPADHPQAFALDPVRVFELPDSIRPSIVLKSTDSDAPRAMGIGPGASGVVRLRPFETLTMEGDVR